MRASRVFVAVLGVFLGAVAPAAAQTAPAAASTTPAATVSTSGFQISVFAGLSSVQNVGGLAGGQAGYRINKQFMIEAEGAWMQDTVRRANLDAIAGLATYLTSAQGKAATATIKAPASYGGGGLRFLFKPDSNVHPYLAAGGGVAKIALTPEITLGGSDITSSLATYGVTLGSDFTGDITKAAFTGGLGVIIDRNRLTIDLGVRLTSIQTDGQPTNVLRAAVGLGYRF